MKKNLGIALIAILGLAFLLFLAYNDEPAPKPHTSHDLTKRFLKDIELLRHGSNKEAVESLRSRIRSTYEEGIDRQGDHVANIPLVLAEARILSKLPVYSVHNNPHKQILMNKTARQDLKLSVEHFPSRHFDPRWQSRNIK